MLAATAHRVRVDDSFGGDSSFHLVQLVDRLGTLDESGFAHARDGQLLTIEEQDAIAATLTSLRVELVVADALAASFRWRIRRGARS